MDLCFFYCIFQKGLSPLHCYLFYCIFQKGLSPLHYAVLSGSVPMIRLLLVFGAKVNAQSPRVRIGQTLAHSLWRLCFYRCLSVQRKRGGGYPCSLVPSLRSHVSFGGYPSLRGWGYPGRHLGYSPGLDRSTPTRIGVSPWSGISPPPSHQDRG